jgi:hypothetical protein
MIEREEFTVGGARVTILPVIKGLKSEVRTVKEAFDQVRPDKVAISLSKEEVHGLRNIPEDFEPLLTRYDEIYADGLSKFGEVASPPPCYIAAIEIADHEGIPLVPVDIDENSYTELYCSAVSGAMLFMHSTRTWLLRRRHFRASNAQEFVLAWDRAVNSLEGFRIIEGKRTESMADGIIAAAKDSDRVLAVIELERATQVCSMLRDRLRACARE